MDIKPIVHATSYGAYETFSNDVIIRKIIDPRLCHLAQGEFKLAEKNKPASKECLDEVTSWLKTIKFGVESVFISKYGEPTLTLLAKRVNGKTLAYAVLVICVARFEYELYSDDIEELQKITELFEKNYKGSEKNDNGNVRFAFWQKDDDGVGDLSNSNNQCPALSEIDSNYPTVLEAVKELVELKDPYKHGKIVLWTGSPGNGKTTLIRALARAWSDVHGIIPEVIIDPENLYEVPSYLTSLLLHGTSQVYSKKEPPFRLVIAEDCAQLFSVEGRSQTGFSRLLNTVDGLLGQGQKIIFLFTANEKIESIDPAILRPGRCLQNLEIPDWTFENAKKWLENRSAAEKIKHLKDWNSLAEMYAILNGTMHAENQKNSFGFK